MNDRDDECAVSRAGLTGRLGHLGVLRFAGTESVQFLQGQLSNDARRLTSKHPLLASCSTPQGRVIAIVRLLPHSTGVLAILPRELTEPLLAHLKKYVMRAKVKIEDLSSQFLVWGRYAADPRRDLESAGLPVPAQDEGYAERDGVAVARVDRDHERFWIVAEPGTWNAAADPIEQAWRLSDVRAGLPQVYAQTSGLFVAQMLNLDLIDGISFTKGCFTGQEIIARTQHLGRIKRRLLRLRLPDGEHRIGGDVRLTDGRSGKLTEVARSASVVEALAVIGDAGESPSAVDGAEELPLPYAASL